MVDLETDHMLPWDRVWAVLDAAGSGDGSQWVSCRNFSRGAKSPQLMAVTAKLDTATGLVTLSHPALNDLTINPDTQGADLIAWAAELVAENRPEAAQVVRAQTADHGQGMSDSPEPHISILGLSSLRALGQKLGQDLSPLRFRGNLWLEGLGPWQEFEWIGKRLRIGGVELLIDERITRCRATEANPDTGRRDAETLKALSDGWDHTDFGVYARVVTPGRVAINDPVEVLS